MSSTTPFVLPLIEAADIAIVGGKALNLGILLRAGLPAPNGFVITTHTYRAAQQEGALPEAAKQAIIDAYARLGRPSVAVRSSATAEDLAEASMAGQYGSHLRIEGDAALLHAIELCWQSMKREGLLAYLTRHGLDPNSVAMAVVVQRMVPADVAGVAFSIDPGTGMASGVVVESAWGLGEAVVSGQVQPDTFRLDAHTGAVVDARISDKAEWYPPRGESGRRPAPPAQRRAPSLTHAQLRDIWSLTQKVAAHFGSPQDIEWGIAAGKLYLLQSRPITTVNAVENPAAVLSAIKHDLAESAGRGSGPWVLHNLGETVPRPTPLTWSVLKQFMSGSGGFGAMYRAAGYSPGPKVLHDGFLELIGGRIYMDVTRAPEMFAADYPYAYDVEKLRSDPQAAQDPPTVPVRSTVSAAKQSRTVYAKLGELAQTLDRDLRERECPAFERWCDEQKRIDLGALDRDALAALWSQRKQKVLDEFAPRSLLPSLVAGYALAELKAFLIEHCWQDDADMLLNELSAGAPPDLTFAANAALYQVGIGRMSLSQWLARFGHRGPGEFDLAAKRWAEQPDQVQELAAQLAKGSDPQKRHNELHGHADSRRAAIVQSLTPAARVAFKHKLDLIDRYLPFREDGKFYLMRGYGLLRDVALEIGRRLNLGDNVFYLDENEMLAAIKHGFAPDAPIASRQRRARAHNLLDLPRLITTDGLDKLGEAQTPANADRLAAFSLSHGFATGPVKICHSPTGNGDLGRGYVLVAPSTDPAWTPLFINAGALVLECGGALSHGAVVAREMGLPAIVIPNATKLLENDETVLVDGNNGVLVRHLNSAGATPPTDEDPTNTRIAGTQIPPAAGAFERNIANIRNVAILIWAIYMAAAFLLPAPWLYDPTMAAFDALLWPLVVSLGKPGAVAVVAAGLAVLTMVMQRFLTDHKRLTVAKKRQQALQKSAAKLPEDSPRRAALLAAASPVAGRLTGAAFVPLGLLLGPMIMLFFWLPARVDRAAMNPAAGTRVGISAQVDPDWQKPVTLTLQQVNGLAIRPDTAAAQTAPPIRTALGKFRVTALAATDLSTQPWEVRAAAQRTRDDMLADLNAFLQAPLPSVPLAWQLTTPTVSGRYAVTLNTPDAAPITAYIALGPNVPPEPIEILTPAGHPLRSVKIMYPKFAEPPPFFKPSWLPFELSWFWVYLLVYLPVMLIARVILRVP